ncbi:MAG: M14 family metallopeptidase [Candidatus Nealsonbacteria bacterium]|nr:M14 family metallopeptidase [Candidatus Nealsonbacteria bacterium]
MKFKHLIIAVFCIAALGAALLMFFASQRAKEVEVSKPAPVPTAPSQTPAETKVPGPERKVLGLSVENREIESFTFGNGPTRLVFVGGIHGGYEWNSVILAYDLMDYLNKYPEFLPKNLAVTVIPSANPDGDFKITGKEGRFTAADIPPGSNVAGRLNAHSVDLNRNFDCGWKPEGVWQNATVSGGTVPFSEPESAAIKKFVLENKPAAVIFWHSQANAIYGSQCGGDMLPETLAIMKAYSGASGYPALTTFDQYEVSGDVTDWLASIGIPAFSVELKTHKTIEWEQNLAGIKALVKFYGNKE